jgi:hypothetical protein
MDELNAWRNRIELKEARIREIKVAAQERINLTLFWLAFAYLLLTSQIYGAGILLMLGMIVYFLTDYFGSGSRPDECEMKATEATRIQCLVIMSGRETPSWWIDDDGNGNKSIEIYDADKFAESFTKNILPCLESMEKMSPFQRSKHIRKLKKSAKLIYEEMNQMAISNCAKPIWWMKD